MLVGPDSVVVSRQVVVHFIIGFLLIGFAGFLHGRSLEGWRNWRGIFNPVIPSLQPGPSAIDKVILGIGGLIGAIMGWSMVTLLTVFGFDQILFAGMLWGWLMDSLAMLFGR